jgi:hypothetical protein
MAKKSFHKKDLLAALKDPRTGKIYKGVMHYDALQEAVAEGNSRVGLENAGFVDPNGKFYSLKQAIRKFKIRSGFRIKPSKT